MILWKILSQYGCAGLCLLFFFTTTPAIAESPDPDLIQMVLDLLQESDKDVRSLAFDQIRTSVPGAAATKVFADALGNLNADAQIGLISALADREDAAAKPAIRAAAHSSDPAVQVAAVRALGKLGNAEDARTLISYLDGESAIAAAASQALVQLRGEGVSTTLVQKIRSSSAASQAKLMELLTTRRDLETIPELITLATGRIPNQRRAAMKALGKLAEPQHVPQLVQAVLRAEPGAERSDAEKQLMLVCAREPELDKRADPLLATMNRMGRSHQVALLPALGRVGGPQARTRIQAALDSQSAGSRRAGLAALCNWPDASVADQLLQLANEERFASYRRQARLALLRLAPVPDGRTDQEKLELLKRAMQLTESAKERNYGLRRAAPIRIVETLRYVLPYLDQAECCEQACQTIVELAHDRQLRDENKEEFHAALDRVLQLTKNAELVERSKRYKQGQTWVRGS